MDLREYLKPLSRTDRQAIAFRAGTSLGHLINMSYGYKPCSPELASGIERATDGAVTRRDLRSDDWHLIWPELAKPKRAKAAATAGA